MTALRIPEAFHFTDQWQCTCRSCGASRAFSGRVATRFSRKLTLGWCTPCHRLRMFNVEPVPKEVRDRPEMAAAVEARSD